MWVIVIGWRSMIVDLGRKRCESCYRVCGIPIPKLGRNPWSSHPNGGWGIGAYGASNVGYCARLRYCSRGVTDASAPQVCNFVMRCQSSINPVIPVVDPFMRLFNLLPGVYQPSRRELRGFWVRVVWTGRLVRVGVLDVRRQRELCPLVWNERPV